MLELVQKTACPGEGRQMPLMFRNNIQNVPSGSCFFKVIPPGVDVVMQWVKPPLGTHIGYPHWTEEC